MIAKNCVRWARSRTISSLISAAIGQDRDLPDQVLGLDRHAVLACTRADTRSVSRFWWFCDDMRAPLGDQAQLLADDRAPARSARPAIASPSTARADWSFASASVDDLGNLRPVAGRALAPSEREFFHDARQAPAGAPGRAAVRRNPRRPFNWSR